MEVKIKNRPQMLVIVAAIAAALLLGDKLIISPLTRGWKERSATIKDLTQRVSEGSLLLQREDTIRLRWGHMRTNVLPESVSTAENEVLRAFERWSQDSRISISSIKPQWKQVADDYMTLECRAEAFGTIEALTRFLFEIEKDELPLRVEAVEIVSRDNDGQQLGVALQVSGLQLKTETE